MTMILDRPATISAEATSVRRLADEAWAIESVLDDGMFASYANSLVLGGREAIVVDTGITETYEAWRDALLSLVDPVSVRWLVLSGDEREHVGNLSRALDLLPNATLAVPAELQHLARGLETKRLHLLREGDALQAGDTILRAVARPACSRASGLDFLDERTGVLWTGGCFGALLSRAVEDASQLHPAEWREGMAMFQSSSSRHDGRGLVADDVRSLLRLGVSAIAGTYTPFVPRPLVGAAFDMLYDLAAA